MSRLHTYSVSLTWTGNTGHGTSSYTDYARSYELSAPGKTPLLGSSDPAFRGDAAKWNPEELLVAALSACHQLWFLHLCADAGIVVTGYTDAATGSMRETGDGGGQFESVTLRPHAVLARGADAARARELHEQAARLCFIARSVAFPVGHEPTFEPQG
jgi:organic hydroperoxide reductase OsmC/OhrA